MTGPKFLRTPVDGPITQPFGDMYSGYPHRGVDFGVVTGTPIYAPADGYSVVHVNDGSFGISVCLVHGDYDYPYTLYAHLSRKMINISDKVKAGDLIGYSGNTGYSTGPHLHWQLCKNTSFPTDISYSDDPMKYIVKEEDLTREETLELIKELQDSGSLASTTDVLSCVAQIVGVDPLTYSDTDKVEAIREVLGIKEE